MNRGLIVAAENEKAKERAAYLILIGSLVGSAPVADRGPITPAYGLQQSFFGWHELVRCVLARNGEISERAPICMLHRYTLHIPAHPHDHFGDRKRSLTVDTPINNG